MKRLTPLLFAAMTALALVSTSALAADDKTADKTADKKATAEKKELTPQQQRMSDCSKRAKGRTGDDYKNFRNACLAGKEPETAASGTPQQAKMKTCAAEGKGRTGDDYKAFMKTCLAK